MTVENIERKSQRAILYTGYLEYSVNSLSPSLPCADLCSLSVSISCKPRSSAGVKQCGGCAVGSGPCCPSHLPKDFQTETLRLMSPRVGCQAWNRNPGWNQGSSSTRSFYIHTKLLPIHQNNQSSLQQNSLFQGLLKYSHIINIHISLFFNITIPLLFSFYFLNNVTGDQDKAQQQ